MGPTSLGATLPGAAILSAPLLGPAALRAAGFGAATSGVASPGGATPGGSTSGPMAPQPPADAGAPVDPKIWQAAQKFEAMAIGQLLAPMFDTVDLSKSKFGGGQGEAAWKPMLVDAIGKQVEAHGGFGLAQSIYAAMLRAQEGRAQAGGALPGTSGQSPPRPAAHQPGKTP